jgi:hypothetical protein
VEKAVVQRLRPIWETPKLDELKLRELEDLADIEVVFASSTCASNTDRPRG